MRCRLTLAVGRLFWAPPSCPDPGAPLEHWRPPRLPEGEAGWLELVLGRQLELRQGKASTTAAHLVGILAESLAAQLGDLNSLGANTGGINVGNAPRFRVGQ